MLATKENHTWMIEEKEEEKVEALKTMELVDGEPTKTIRVRMTMSTDMKKKLVQFLKENLDIFVWSHEDTRHIHRNHPIKVKRGPREKSYPAKTMSVCSRTKPSDYG